MLRKGSLSVSATGARLHHSATDYQRFLKDIEHHRHSLDDISSLATTIAHSQAFDSHPSNFAPLIHAQVEASKAFVEHCAKTMRRYEEALGGTSKQNVLKRIYWRIHWHVSRSSAAAAEARWRMSEDRALCVAQLTSEALKRGQLQLRSVEADQNHRYVTGFYSAKACDADVSTLVLDDRATLKDAGLQVAVLSRDICFEGEDDTDSKPTLAEDDQWPIAEIVCGL